MANSCPICHRDDAIQKVSEIVSSGITLGGEASGVYSMTDLGRILARPEEPKLSFGHGWGKYGCMIPFALFILFWAVSGLIVLSVLLVNIEIRAIPRVLTYFAIFGCVPIFLAFGVAVFIFTVQGKVDRKDAVEYSTDHPRWQKAIEKWDTLYFCYRDEIVFDPATQEICQPDDLRAFIDRQ
jgi:hypothetical protein